MLEGIFEEEVFEHVVIFEVGFFVSLLSEVEGGLSDIDVSIFDEFGHMSVEEGEE